MKIADRENLPQAIAVLALVALVRSFADADAVADQKKAYEAMGIKIPHPAAMCGLLTKAEVTRVLGEPVANGESAGADVGCAYRTLADRNRGVLVVRHARGDWYVSTKADRYHEVTGVGERAYTDFESIGYAAGVLASNGVTLVQLSGKGSAGDALALAKIAMKR